MRTYYLALVTKAAIDWNVAYARHDENMRSFVVSQDEGGFASLSVVIEKPSQSLLNPFRPQWVWLSMEEDGEITPLFFGRVIGIPVDLQKQFVTLEFSAKPQDFEFQKRMVASTLRVAPYWNYAFIDPLMWDDPDAVLEARTDVWHIDRVSHELSISSIIQGEAGIIGIPASELRSEDFALSYGEPPLRRVVLEMRAMWTQQRKGTLDASNLIKIAFNQSGSPDDFVTSYTGSALYNDWPEEGDSIGSIYEFGPQVIEVADGNALPKQSITVNVQYESAPDGSETSVSGLLAIGGSGRSLSDLGQQVSFRRWGFLIESTIRYDLSVSRTEDIRFNVLADIQNMLGDPEDEQSETITISSGNIGVTVGVDTHAYLPIEDVSRSSFFTLKIPGPLAIEYGLAHARALLMRRARAVHLSCAVPFERAVEATLRKSATLTHPDLPGGSVTGKIVSYQFGVDGATGAEFGSISIAAMVGQNTTITEDEGTPVWGDDDYAGPDYQEFVGATRFAVEGQMQYGVPSAKDIFNHDIGIDSVEVLNGDDVQTDILGGSFLDIAQACDTLNQYPTIVTLNCRPVDTSPVVHRFATSNVFLKIPQGIDLGA
jgi:hypothetical protein